MTTSIGQDDKQESDNDHMLQVIVMKKTNMLLQQLGFVDKEFSSFPDLLNSASSMIVALYEKIFQTRLANIIRLPSSVDDYTRNAQQVIKCLSEKTQLPNIRMLSGEMVSRGEIKCIQILVETLSSLYYERENSRNIKYPNKQSVKEPSGKKKNVKYKRDIKRRVGKNKESLSTVKNSKNTLKSNRDASDKTMINLHLKDELDFGSVSSVEVASSDDELLLMKKHMEKPKFTRKVNKKVHLKKKSTNQARTSYFETSNNKNPHQLRLQLALKEYQQKLSLEENKHRCKIQREFCGHKIRNHIEKIRSSRLKNDLRIRQLSVRMKLKHQEERRLNEMMKRILKIEEANLRHEHQKSVEEMKNFDQRCKEQNEALENYYFNQISMIKDQAKRELQDRELMKQAQRLASDKILREVREDKERQLKLLIDQQDSWFYNMDNKVRIIQKSSIDSSKVNLSKKGKMKRKERYDQLKRIYGKTA